MDVKKYRQECEAEIKRAAGTYESAKPADARDLLAEKAGDPEDRIAAIEMTPMDPEDLGDYVEQCLRTVRDGSEAVAVRLAALNALNAADFLGPQFDAYRADFLQAMREVATDRSPKLREAALEVLAIHKDPYAQEMLLKGLKDKKAALVSEAKTIQLLGYDDHTDVVPTVRAMFDKATNAAKEEALRLLASDPGSERFLSKLLQDKSQRSMIRQLSAAGLQNLNPTKFSKIARKIVGDNDDYNEIRATCVAALTTDQDSGSATTKKGFAKQVSELLPKTRSTNLRSSIKRYLQSIED